MKKPRIEYIDNKDGKKYSHKMPHLGVFLRLLRLEDVGGIRDLKIIPVDYSKEVNKVYALGRRLLKEDDIGDFDHLKIKDKLPTLDQFEKLIILESLKRVDWIQKYAAEMLGISPRALNYKISCYGITHTSWKVNVKRKLELVA